VLKYRDRKKLKAIQLHPKVTIVKDDEIYRIGNIADFAFRSIIATNSNSCISDSPNPFKWQPLCW